MTTIDHGGMLTVLTSELADDLAAASLSLARAFHAGATLLVAAPRWEPHAHHVAVEFVHPVIVGKRALPSVALTGDDLVAQARVAGRTGDVLVLIADAADPTARDLARRCPAWGLTCLWIGAGERPEPGAADHVLWVERDDPLVPATGQFVLLYHLLWELTHVCFEQPHLLSAAGETACSTEEIANGTCTTCSDEGRPGEVLELPDEAFGLALVRTAAGEEEVDISLVDVQLGDLILIHAGSAITRLGGRDD